MASDNPTAASIPEDEFDLRNRERRSGIRLGMKLHLIQIPLLLAGAVFHNLPGLLMGVCMTQWFYLVPAIILQFIKKRRSRAAGVLLAGLLTMAVWTFVGLIVLAVLCSNLGR